MFFKKLYETGFVNKDDKWQILGGYALPAWVMEKEQELDEIIGLILDKTRHRIPEDLQTDHLRVHTLDHRVPL